MPNKKEDICVIYVNNQGILVEATDDCRPLSDDEMEYFKASLRERLGSAFTAKEPAKK